MFTEVARNDNVNYVWAFVCSLYGNTEKDANDIDDTRHNSLVKAKRDLEVLPTTHDALELQITS